MRQQINQHEGRKYLRTVHDAMDPSKTVRADVYEFLLAFEVICPACQHAIKKILAAGQRGKGSKAEDLKGAMAALNRAVDFAERKKTLGEVDPDLTTPPDIAEPIEGVLVDPDPAGKVPKNCVLRIKTYGGRHLKGARLVTSWGMGTVVHANDQYTDVILDQE